MGRNSTSPIRRAHTKSCNGASFHSRLSPLRPVRENRRNSGVNRVKQGRQPKKSLKILLTENDWCKILPLAPVTAFPPEVRSDVPLLSARRTKSARSTGVFTTRKRDDEFIGNG